MIKNKISRRSFIKVSIASASLAAFGIKTGLAKPVVYDETHRVQYEGLPEGFLPCDGRKMSRHQYPELFQAIGNQYGEFKLPDLRGKFIRTMFAKGAEEHQPKNQETIFLIKARPEKNSITPVGTVAAAFGSITR